MKLFFKNLSLNNISIFLLLIFPASLVTGPLISEICMNLISGFFVYQIIKDKNFRLFKDTIFIFFILFYLIIILSIFFSEYFDDIFFKNIFYFRYIFFIFAVASLLAKNKFLILLFYKVLLITLLIISIDGFIQFFTGHNLIGYTKIRPDRVSGFFGDKLILGSFLSRFTPLLFGLFILNLKQLKFSEKIFGLTVIFLTFLAIMVSGERMAFYTICLYFFSIAFLLDIKKRIKFIFFSTISVSAILILLFSPTIVDRYYKQTVDQVNFNFDKQNFFSNFVFYKNIYSTAYMGFLDNKIIGNGPKSFRYFCNKDKYLSNLPLEEKSYILGGIIEGKDIFIQDIKFKKDDLIKHGDILFTYLENKKLKSFEIDKTWFPKKIIFERIKLPPNYDQKNNKPLDMMEITFEFYAVESGCTTHPHNFYLQFLSETGLVGFIFVLFIFCLLVYKISKNFVFSLFHKKSILNNFQISLIIGFIITLLPLIPNGNFFNNWLSMVMYLPVGFYIFSLKGTKK